MKERENRSRLIVSNRCVPVENAPSDKHGIACQTKHLFDHTDIYDGGTQTQLVLPISHTSIISKGFGKMLRSVNNPNIESMVDVSHMYRTVVPVARSKTMGRLSGWKQGGT